MRRVKLVTLLALAGCPEDKPTLPPPIPKAPPPAATAPVAAPAQWPPPLPSRPAAPAAKPAAPTVQTLNGDPKGPRAEDLTPVLQAAGPSLQACLDKETSLPAGTVNLQISYAVKPAGQAADVKVSGAAPPTALACVQKTIEGLKFPAFEGAPVMGNYPLTYSKVATQK